jgi:hypothetical protein
MYLGESALFARYFGGKLAEISNKNNDEGNLAYYNNFRYKTE